MKKNLLLLGMASVFALTACHGTKKVDFKAFGEAVEKAAEESKDLKVKKVKVSGKLNGEKFKAFTVDFKSEEAPELDEKQADAYAVCEASATVFAVYALYATLPEAALENFTFYTGNGFKIKGEDKDSKSKSSMEFDKKGLLASLKGEVDGKKTSISVKWTLEK